MKQRKGKAAEGLWVLDCFRFVCLLIRQDYLSECDERCHGKHASINSHTAAVNRVLMLKRRGRSATTVMMI